MMIVGRTLIVVLVVALSVVVRAEDDVVCCPSTKILHARLEVQATAPPSARSANPRQNSKSKSEVEKIIADAVSDSWGVRRRLDQDATCVSGRTEAITEWWAGSVDSYELKGETLVEGDFTRFVYDMSLVDTYWKVDDASTVPPEQQVVVLTLPEADHLPAGWLFDDGLLPTDVCDDGAFSIKDMYAALMDRQMMFVILASPASKQSWLDWYDEWVVASEVNCGDHCLVVVGDRTSGLLVDDVHTALAAMDFNGTNPFESCTPCLHTTTTPGPTATTSSALHIAPSTTTVFTVLSLAVLSVLA